MNAVLIRYKTTEQGTRGFLVVGGLVLETIELPWKDNAPNRSCIPAGTYPVQHLPRTPSGRKNVFWVRNVPGRTGILFHVGNYAGDVDKGYRSDSLGCILPGLRIGTLAGQDVVLSSAPAMRKLNEVTGKKDFTLTITETLTWNG